MTLTVEDEVAQLVEEIKRLGNKDSDGKTSVRYCSNQLVRIVDENNNNCTNCFFFLWLFCAPPFLNKYRTSNTD